MLDIEIQLKPIVNLNNPAKPNAPWITIGAAGMGSAY
jgi:hypothetical protein